MLVEGPAARVAVGRGLLVDVGIDPAPVLDDIGRVVGDDVHIDLQAAGMGLADELAELVVGAQVRIHLEEIRDPITVITGGALLHGLVFQRRGQPDRGDAEALEVIQPRGQPGKVAAVVMADFGRVEAVFIRPARVTAGVVFRAAVGKSVGEDEVEGLAGTGVREARHRDRIGGANGDGGGEPGQQAEDNTDSGCHGVSRGCGRGAARQTGRRGEVLHGREKT